MLGGYTYSPVSADPSRCPYIASRFKDDTERERPSVDINQGNHELLRELRFSWNHIAALFGVWRPTLYTASLQCLIRNCMVVSI